MKQPFPILEISLPKLRFEELREKKEIFSGKLGKENIRGKIERRSTETRGWGFGGVEEAERERKERTTAEEDREERRGGPERRNKEWNINRFASVYMGGSTCPDLHAPPVRSKPPH